MYSCAYIAFRTEEVVAKFSREHDGHIFKGLSFRHLFSVLEVKMSRSVSMHKGHKSQAVVVFAAYQHLTPEKRK